MNYQLWMEPGDCQTFCLGGPQGNTARKLLHPDARLVWEVEAPSHFEAMTRYYAYMQWGEYKSNLPEQEPMP
ncbi:hypothetical protein [Pseudomonas protegens]|uniref:hypothetical protein n=1 Tax=Pseudomonas protegens TaxID=380021 RepID=UPI0021606DC5|nr:hypothetical protein [Pseudomonas protegens]UVM13479.1 hypothetical protein LOY29_12675 [Pseudomonas protegens]